MLKLWVSNAHLVETFYTLQQNHQELYDCKGHNGPWFHSEDFLVHFPYIYTEKQVSIVVRRDSWLREKTCRDIIDSNRESTFSISLFSLLSCVDNWAIWSSVLDKARSCERFNWEESLKVFASSPESISNMENEFSLKLCFWPASGTMVPVCEALKKRSGPSPVDWVFCKDVLSFKTFLLIILNFFVDPVALIWQLCCFTYYYFRQDGNFIAIPSTLTFFCTLRRQILQVIVKSNPFQSQSGKRNSPKYKSTRSTSEWGSVMFEEAQATNMLTDSNIKYLQARDFYKWDPINPCCPPSSDLNKLIMNYLVIEGFKDAAVKFSSETKIDPMVNLESIQDRMNIRNSVQEGNIEHAIEQVNDLDPEARCHCFIMDSPLIGPIFNLNIISLLL